MLDSAEEMDRYAAALVFPRGFFTRNKNVGLFTHLVRSAGAVSAAGGSMRGAGGGGVGLTCAFVLDTDSPI